MVRLNALVGTLALFAPTSSLAVAETPPDHSTVRLVFVAPFDQPTQMMGSIQEDGKPVMMGSAGGAVVPFASIRPVSISIDGESIQEYARATGISRDEARQRMAAESSRGRSKPTPVK